MSDYPAGTVAVATVRGVPNMRVMAFCGGTGSYSWLSSEYLDGGRAHSPSEVTDVRQLHLSGLFERRQDGEISTADEWNDITKEPESVTDRNMK